MKPDKLKVLMIGLGGIGQRHVRNLKYLRGDSLEILAYRSRGANLTLTDDLTIEPGVDLENKYAIKSFRNFEEALDQKPQVAFITNPSSLHIPMAIRIAEAGCHLFVEKPLSHSLEGVNKLIHEIEKRKLIGMVGYQLRFHPCLKFVNELLEAKRIGRILSAKLEVGEYLPNWHRYEDYRKMYASRSNLGGGVILSQIHELDLVYWWFGLPRQVFALGGHWTSLELDVEDTSSMLLECETEDRPLPVHVQQDYTQRPPYRCYQIVGEEGKIFVNLTTAEVILVDFASSKQEISTINNFQRNQLFVDEISHFLECVQYQRQPDINIYDGAQSLLIAVSALESIKSHKMVSVWEKFEPFRHQKRGEYN